MSSYFIEDLSVGMQASHAKTVSEDDINSFAEVSGDFNPVHRARLACFCEVGGKVVLEGEATVFVPSRA